MVVSSIDGVIEERRKSNYCALDLPIYKNGHTPLYCDALDKVPLLPFQIVAQCLRPISRVQTQQSSAHFIRRLHEEKNRAVDITIQILVVG